MKKCHIYETLNPINEMKVDRSSGLMTLSGTFGVCGVVNNNKRIYEKNNYAACVSEMQKRIREHGGIPGELEHPQTMNITLENVSHKITNISIDEHGLVTGTIQLLDTPKGKIAQAIVEGGLPLFVSSRATGQVDKNGKVTLENISCYDLVGTPGFSQAKMKLNENQSYESINESLCIISEGIIEEEMDFDELVRDLHDKIDEAAERHDNDFINEDAPVRSKGESKTIEKLMETIELLKADMNYLKAVSKVREQNILAEAKSMIENDVTNMINETVSIFEADMNYLKTIGKVRNDNIINEAKEYVNNDFANSVSEYLKDIVIPTINENVQEKLSNFVNESKVSKSDRLDDVLNMLAVLESQEEPKPVLGRVLNESHEPPFIQNMPSHIRPIWNMADPMVKESVMRRARLRDLNTPSQIQNFWESIDLDTIKPSQNVYESLNNIEDLRERQIRAALRRNR